MGRMDPTPNVGMPNRVSNVEKSTLTNVGMSVDFIHSPSFHKWSHSHVAWVFVQAIAQHTKQGFSFSHTHTHTHTKQKQKKTIKIRNLKRNIQKTKKREQKKNNRKNRNK